MSTNGSFQQENDPREDNNPVENHTVLEYEARENVSEIMESVAYAFEKGSLRSIPMTGSEGIKIAELSPREVKDMFKEFSEIPPEVWSFNLGSNGKPMFETNYGGNVFKLWTNEITDDPSFNIKTFMMIRKKTKETELPNQSMHVALIKPARSTEYVITMDASTYTESPKNIKDWEPQKGIHFYGTVDAKTNSDETV